MNEKVGLNIDRLDADGFFRATDYLRMLTPPFVTIVGHFKYCRVVVFPRFHFGFNLSLAAYCLIFMF